MKKDIRNDLTDALGYYVEGDYMSEETNDNSVIFSCESDSKMRLSLTSHHSIVLCIPHDDMSSYEFVFKNKEDWENFCEAVWKTEHYMAVRKKDFIEFFQALRHLHGHHCRQLDVVAERQEKIDREIYEQQDRLKGLDRILKHYEDQYTEAYKEVRNESKV